MPEFGPQKNQNETKTTFEKYIEELKGIGEVAIYSPDLGWHKLGYFQGRLPPHLKEKVKQETVTIAESSFNDSLALKITIDKISTILYDFYKCSKKVSE